LCCRPSCCSAVSLISSRGGSGLLRSLKTGLPNGTYISRKKVPILLNFQKIFEVVWWYVYFLVFYQ
jgi:hypothetical protein